MSSARTLLISGLALWLILLCASQVLAVYTAGEGPFSSIVAGPATSGVAFALSSPSAMASISKPVLVTVEIRNMRASVVALDGVQAALAYKFTATDLSTGKSLRAVAITKQSSSAVGPIYIQAHQAVFMKVTLTDYVDLDKPGDYRIVGRASPLSDMNGNSLALISNPLTLHVGP